MAVLGRPELEEMPSAKLATIGVPLLVPPILAGQPPVHTFANFADTVCGICVGDGNSR